MGDKLLYGHHDLYLVGRPLSGCGAVFWPSVPASGPGHWTCQDQGVPQVTCQNVKMSRSGFPTGSISICQDHVFFPEGQNES